MRNPSFSQYIQEYISKSFNLNVTQSTFRIDNLCVTVIEHFAENGVSIISFCAHKVSSVIQIRINES